MPKTAFHISLKDYVEGSDFDRTTVDGELARNDDKRLNVLIDSLGGSTLGLRYVISLRHSFYRVNVTSSCFPPASVAASATSASTASTT